MFLYTISLDFVPTTMTVWICDQIMKGGSVPEGILTNFVRSFEDPNNHLRLTYKKLHDDIRSSEAA